MAGDYSGLIFQEKYYVGLFDDDGIGELNRFNHSSISRLSACLSVSRLNEVPQLKKIEDIEHSHIEASNIFVANVEYCYDPELEPEIREFCIKNYLYYYGEENQSEIISAEIL